jgi:hypothetical protein
MNKEQIQNIPFYRDIEYSKYLTELKIDVFVIMNQMFSYKSFWIDNKRIGGKK